MRRPYALAQALLIIFILAVSTPILFAKGQTAVREWKLGERTLSMGSWGADVFTLQLQLRELGYELKADGLYGPETKSVVEAFQRDHGIEVTGVAGPITVERLTQAVAQARLRRIETMPYTVKPGDSLWSIARAFGTTMELIIEINGLPDRPLRAGEVIQVPALGRYEVKPGDTLWGIARRFGTTVKALADLNGISPDGVLRVGTVLLLPRESRILPET